MRPKNGMFPVICCKIYTRSVSWKQLLLVVVVFFSLFFFFLFDCIYNAVLPSKSDNYFILSK